MPDYVPVDGETLVHVESGKGAYFRPESQFDIVGQGIYELAHADHKADQLVFSRLTGDGDSVLTMSLGEFARQLNDRVRPAHDLQPVDSLCTSG